MPSNEIVTAVIGTFASGMTARGYGKALLLIVGMILTPGRRTVCAVLRTIGLDGTEQGSKFMKYHRLLNRDRWSAMVMSKRLLHLLIETFVRGKEPLVIGVDETLERRPSDQIPYTGCYRDAARSRLKHLVTSFGIRWLVMALMVKVPWSTRQWALPFLILPTRTKSASQERKRHHRTVTGWAMLMIVKVRRWQPKREIVIVADRSYAQVALLNRCQRLSPRPIQFITSLRMDAGLYDLPMRSAKTGRLLSKGLHQPNPRQVLSDPTTPWSKRKICWYGGRTKVLRISTRCSMWAKRGTHPVCIRWVLITCPADPNFKPVAIMSSDSTARVEDIIARYILRWNIEVTFEEARAHLGFETQRQWSPRAIERATPCLLGMFSLVTLLAAKLFPHRPPHPLALPARSNAWYHKLEPTFSDALAAVRLRLWSNLEFQPSSFYPNGSIPPTPLHDRFRILISTA